MSVLSRLFRRRAPAAPGEVQPPAAPADALAAPPATTPPATAVEAPESADEAPGPATAADEPALPLRSLNRYRQDPAYKNFMAKAQKRPGATRRPGIPADYLDGERRPR